MYLNNGTRRQRITVAAGTTQIISGEPGTKILVEGYRLRAISGSVTGWAFRDDAVSLQVPEANTLPCHRMDYAEYLDTQQRIPGMLGRVPPASDGWTRGWILLGATRPLAITVYGDADARVEAEILARRLPAETPAKGTLAWTPDPPRMDAGWMPAHTILAGAGRTTLASGQHGKRIAVQEVLISITGAGTTGWRLYSGPRHLPMQDEGSPWFHRHRLTPSYDEAALLANVATAPGEDLAIGVDGGALAGVRITLQHGYVSAEMPCRGMLATAGALTPATVA